MFRSGSFYEAIRASVAIPTIITPVKYMDTILVDGGVLNPVPTEHVERSKDDILIVVNLYGQRNDKIEKSNLLEAKNQTSTKLETLLKNISKLISSGDRKSLGYFSLVNASTLSMVHKLAQQSIKIYKPDILINIPNDSSKTFDFHKAEKLIEIGENIASKEISNYLNSN